MGKPRARGRPGPRLSEREPLALPIDRNLGYGLAQQRVPHRRLACAGVRRRARAPVLRRRRGHRGRRRARAAERWGNARDRAHEYRPVRTPGSLGGLGGTVAPWRTAAYPQGGVGRRPGRGEHDWRIHFRHRVPAHRLRQRRANRCASRCDPRRGRGYQGGAEWIRHAQRSAGNTRPAPEDPCRRACGAQIGPGRARSLELDAGRDLRRVRASAS
jgi:hypothetical protein